MINRLHRIQWMNLVFKRRISHSSSDRGFKEFGRLPKVELHRHLEGAVRLDTVLDLAKEYDVPLPHGLNGDMTSSNLLTYEGIKPHIQTLKPFPNLETLLAIFDHTQSTFKKVDALYRIAKEAVYDANEEGIVALELRYAPSFCSMNHNHNFEDVLSVIESGIKDAVDDIFTLQGKRMAVGILCIGVGAMGHDHMNRTKSKHIQALHCNRISTRNTKSQAPWISFLTIKTDFVDLTWRVLRRTSRRLRHSFVAFVIAGGASHATRAKIVLRENPRMHCVPLRSWARNASDTAFRSFEMKKLCAKFETVM